MSDAFSWLKWQGSNRVLCQLKKEKTHCQWSRWKRSERIIRVAKFAIFRNIKMISWNELANKKTTQTRLYVASLLKQSSWARGTNIAVFEVTQAIIASWNHRSTTVWIHDNTGKIGRTYAAPLRVNLGLIAPSTFSTEAASQRWQVFSSQRLCFPVKLDVRARKVGTGSLWLEGQQQIWQFIVTR